MKTQKEIEKMIEERLNCICEEEKRIEKYTSIAKRGTNFSLGSPGLKELTSIYENGTIDGYKKISKWKAEIEVLKIVLKIN